MKRLDYFEFYQLEKESVINIQTLKVIESYELISKMEVLKKESKLQAEKQLILDKKNKDEIKALKQRQDFLSVMSHEIRTPLNAITSIVALLKDKVENEDFELVDTLQFASSNLIKIVNDVLDFTKLDLNKSQLELSPVDLVALATNIKKVYENQAANKGLIMKLNCDVDNELLYNIDELKITQVLTNLLSNAIKFSNKGTIEINIHITNKGNKKNTIYFGVSDNGEGISKTNKSEVFRSFLQVKPILTRNEGGTGLGLAIVKKIIELHGGKIKVKSKLGKGSTFYFSIKASFIKKKKEEKVLKINSKLLDQKLNGLNVLIVEDTIINAFLLIKVLSKWNIVSEHVERGKLAIEKAKKIKYDIILMDIHMPEMNGFEAASKIKKNKNLNNETPIIAITADTFLKSDTYNLDCFSGVVLKPFEIENLKKTLLSVL